MRKISTLKKDTTPRVMHLGYAPRDETYATSVIMDEARLKLKAREVTGCIPRVSSVPERPVTRGLETATTPSLAWGGSRM